MELISSVEEMRLLCADFKKKPFNVGLVPTMGALHDGHISLIKKSTEDNEITLVSIFLNPAQFNSATDLKSYPRTIENDSRLCNSLDIDLLFVPSADQIYPSGYSTWIDIEGITEKLCGLKRPGHFRGVSTVVMKLLTICSPDFAYFGEKDYQQFLIVQRMCFDLMLDTEVVLCPIIREKDGLALSSRNVNLSQKDRKLAILIIKAMKEVEKLFYEGERNCIELIEKAKEILSVPNLYIEYIDIVDSVDLESLQKIESTARIMIAVKIGSVRLIDNLSLEL
tara:strand:+ start:1294 stop:2136 length:843 start_codon:yes stop_codon:yes gene_type:complete